jgi:hypothetical protein
MEGGIKRHGRSAGCDDSEVRRHPSWMIRRQNCHASIPRHASGEPIPDTLRHTSQFRKRDSLDSLLPLNLKRNIIREFAGGFLETLVESGHELRANDTGSGNPKPR